DVHSVFIDDGPEAVAVGKVGSAFVHERSGAVGQGPKHDVRVAGNPADVCGTPIDVVFFNVEDVAMSGGYADQVTGGSVHDALRLAGGSAGVEDEKHVLGV